MKLYLSSYRIPAPDDLAELLGKPLSETTCALIPNAQDYYSKRSKTFKVGAVKKEFEGMGMKVRVIDLQDYDSAGALQKALSGYDLIWAMGGNTFCLRYEMQRSGFDEAIRELLAEDRVYAGDSAGALVAGVSIAGIESADEPAYAEKTIEDGVGLVPYVILPHVDNPEFTEAARTVRDLRRTHKDLIELKDSQAVIFNDGEHHIVEAAASARTQEKEPQPQLSNRLAEAAEAVTVGARYRHYKGQEYTVTGLGLREADSEPCVVYRAEYGESVTWIRPLADWLEHVAVEGKLIARFQKVGEG